jgi:CRISPR-associated protein Cas2
LRTLYLVTYDIREEGRLQRVYKFMRGYGEHLQYSVFRCELSDLERVNLMAKLTELIKTTEDQVLFFSLGPAGGMREGSVYSLGQPYVPTEHVAIVV